MIKPVSSPDYFPRLLEIQIECIRELTDTYTSDELDQWIDYIHKESPTRYAKYSNAISVDDVSDVQGFVSWTCEGGEGQIECLYVQSQHRHKGLGKQLLQHAETALKDKSVYVRSTLNARSFYEKNGYIFVNSSKSRAGFVIACLEKQL